MTEAVYAGGGVTCVLDRIFLAPVVSELPVLNLVDGDASDPASRYQEFARLGRGGESDTLSLRLIVRLLVRCVPFLRPVARPLTGMVVCGALLIAGQNEVAALTQKLERSLNAALAMLADSDKGEEVRLDDLTDASVGASQDKNKAAKMARLRELLLISEWFDVPLYGDGAALPEQQLAHVA